MSKEPIHVCFPLCPLRSTDRVLKLNKVNEVETSEALAQYDAVIRSMREADERAAGVNVLSSPPPKPKRPSPNAAAATTTTTAPKHLPFVAAKSPTAARTPQWSSFKSNSSALQSPTHQRPAGYNSSWWAPADRPTSPRISTSRDVFPAGSEGTPKHGRDHVTSPGRRVTHGSVSPRPAAPVTPSTIGIALSSTQKHRPSFGARRLLTPGPSTDKQLECFLVSPRAQEAGDLHVTPSPLTVAVLSGGIH